MKKLIYGVSFLALVGIIIVGCQKENLDPTFSITPERNQQKGTGKVDPIEFGRLHNEYLIEAMEYSFNDKSLTNKEALMLVDIPKLTDEEEEEIYDYFSNLTEQEMKEKTFEYLVNPKAKEYYNEIEYALNNTKLYSNLNTKLDVIAKKINENLDETDWDIVMVVLETGRASSHVWFSEENGGSGIGYKFAMKSPSHMNKRSWIAADGIGAGLGMVAWSFSAFLGPVGIAGFAYGAISGAVGSSISN